MQEDPEEDISICVVIYQFTSFGKSPAALQFTILKKCFSSFFQLDFFLNWKVTFFSLFSY